MMILLMILPSLACAMPTCVGEAKAEMSDQPCSDHHPGQEKGDNNVDLLLDCMGVDLQQVEREVQFEKSDPQTNFKIYALLNNTLGNQLTYVSVITIREPPEWRYATNLSPPIILSTQRFRI